MSDLGNRIAKLSPEQRALLERRLTEKADTARSTGREPIAITGMGCRFPGGADSPKRYWDLLARGVDVVSEVPEERWNAASLYDPDWAVAGKTNTRWGGFLDHIDMFDADFFGIAPREAAHMDPQQRLLLEVAWEALEDGGQPPEGLSGSRCGVFIGIHAQSNDYHRLVLADRTAIDTYTSTGTAHSIAANRLSYFLDLRGPSIAVDSACSSSLVAVHLACQSLMLGECDVALAGGVNLVLSPEMTIAFSKLQLMASDGRCKAFDSRADGFARGEGCGVVLLKRASDAEADGDNVWALVRGSAVNQDGRTNGLTAPSGLAQEAVVRAALESAGLSPRDLGLIEAHGTGTALGDSIEVGALAAVFGDGEDHECALGSVKANIGHLETAAGVASLIKAVLCVHHGTIPPQLHFKDLNPHVSLSGTPFVIAREGRPWPTDGGPRHAGISSFGFGGTNAHLIVAARPEAPRAAVESVAPVGHLVPLSARDPRALRLLALAYRDSLDDRDRQVAYAVRDLAHTGALRRTHHPHRMALVVESAAQMAESLGHYLEDQDDPRVLIAPELPDGRSHRLAWLFGDHTPQPPGPLPEALDRQPIFRATAARGDEWLEENAGVSLGKQLRALADRPRQAELSEAATFVLQAAVADVWRSWGIEPDIVIGNGLGEYAAAYAAGALGFDDALRVIAGRKQDGAATGAMASLQGVELGRASVEIVTARAGGSPRSDRGAAADRPADSERPGALTAALEELIDRGYHTFLQIGVWPGLGAPIDSWFRERDRPEHGAALIEPRPTGHPLLVPLGTLYVRGLTIDWQQVTGRQGRHVRLPTYPWQRRRHWIDTAGDLATRAVGAANTAVPAADRQAS